MYKAYSLLFFIFIIIACNEEPTNAVTEKKMTTHLFQNCQQLVIVTTKNEDTHLGVLRKFVKKEDKWVVHESSHPITLGRTGLAWGNGMHDKSLATGYHKKEGDGKSPAGIFKFGVAFGYASKEALPNSIPSPYVPITEVTQCIEDGQSAYYNQIIDNRKITKDWNTADFMRRDDDLYKWGIFVDHNVPAKAGNGSCIFFHLWRGDDKPTAGCTAMTEENIWSLISWLDPVKNPLLVQLVEKDYPRFEEKYGLPDL